MIGRRMDRVLPRPPVWRWILAAALTPVAVINLLAAARAILLGMGSVAFDYRIYVEASHRFFDGGLYQVSDFYAYVYSPVIAPALRALEWIGMDAWRALHVAAVLALPTWRMRLLTLVLWPFWYDVQLGNVMVFIAVMAAWTLRRNQLGTAAFLITALLIPKPLMLPVLAWVLWKQAEWRGRFVALAAAHALAVVATGYADEWVARLMTPSYALSSVINFGPSRLIGLWWMLLAAPAAAWLTWKGKLGFASLLASPYWLPYYGLMLLIELPDAHRRAGVHPRTTALSSWRQRCGRQQP